MARPTKDEVIYALRCTSAEGNSCEKKENCPYFYITPPEEREGFKEQFNMSDEEVERFDWTTCDLDQISKDAADLLEFGEIGGKNNED